MKRLWLIGEWDEEVGKKTAYCHQCCQKTKLENPKKQLRGDNVFAFSNPCPTCGCRTLFSVEGKIPLLEIGVEIPSGQRLDITTTTGNDHWATPTTKAVLRFKSAKVAVVLCENLMNVLLREDLEFYPEKKESTMKKILELCVSVLEEKFGYECLSPDK